MRLALFAGVFSISSTVAPVAAGQTTIPSAEAYVWKNVEIVGGGFVSGLTFNPTMPGLLFARTDIGGAYRLDATSNRWIPLNDSVGPDDWNMYGIESLATDPVEPRRLYLACGTYTRDFASNASIYRSADGGSSWLRSKLPFKMGGNEEGRSIGERLAIDPNANRVLYFGSRNDGLWKSEDFGATWGKIERFPVAGRTNGIGVGFVIFDKSSGLKGVATPTIYVAVESKDTHLYRSTDAGMTWAEVPGQIHNFLPHHGVLTSEGSLHITYGNGPGPNGMTDGAVRTLDTHTGEWIDITPIAPTAAQHFGYAGVSVDAKHPQTIIVSTMDRWNPGDDIFRSTDGGKNWKPLKPKATRDSSEAPYLNWGKNTPEFGHWIGDVEIDPHDPDHALYGTGATIWETHDLTKSDVDGATHWTVRAAGLEETAVLDLISPTSGAHLISAIGDVGGFVHHDLTISPKQGMFENPRFVTGRSVDFAELKPGIVVRAGNGPQGRHGAISEDGGETWRPFETTPPGAKPGGHIIVTADGSVIVWSPDGTAPCVSFDGGRSWATCEGITGEARLAADRVNPRKVYALQLGRALFISDNAGKTFRRSDFRPTRGGTLRAAPRHEGDLWLAGGDGGALRSTDSGATFAKIVGVQKMDTVGFGKPADGHEYPAVYMAGRIAGVAGIFRSDDAGASWVRINDDAHQYGNVGTCVIGDPRVFGRVFVATNGRGILVAEPAMARHP